MARILTRARHEALTDFAERGMDELAYDVREATGVDITERDDAVVHEQIREYTSGVMVEYDEHDLQTIIARYRRARVALGILYSRWYPSSQGGTP